MNRLTLVILTMLIGCLPSFSNLAMGQDSEIVVRTSIEPSDEVLVGQKIELTVDVLAKDAWATLPKLPEFEVPAAIVYLPDSQSTRLSESIGGSSYTGQRYQWWIYPRRAGTIAIDAIDLQISKRVFGSTSDPEVFSKQTEAKSLQAKYPEGVLRKNDFFSAESVEVTEQWDPIKTNDLKVGDAVTRKITRTIGGAPGMLLAEVPPEQIDGIRAYPKQPSVVDKSDRGDLQGKRTEAITYVFEAGGEFTFPALQFEWWNERSKKLETIELPERLFEVAAAEVSEEATTSADGTDPIGGATTGKPIPDSTWYWLAGLAALGLVLYSSRDWLKQKIHEFKTSPFVQERKAFNRLVVAAQSGDRNKAINELYLWMNYPLADQEAPQLDVLLERFGEESEATAITELVGNAVETWDSSKFIQACRKLRQNWQSSTVHINKRKASALPELNQF